MKGIRLAALLGAMLPAIAMAQGAPVAKAFRDDASAKGKNLIAAAEAMPAADFLYKPTPAQMSYASVLMHLDEQQITQVSQELTTILQGEL